MEGKGDKDTCEQIRTLGWRDDIPLRLESEDVLLAL